MSLQRAPFLPASAAHQRRHQRQRHRRQNVHCQRRKSEGEIGKRGKRRSGRNALQRKLPESRVFLFLLFLFYYLFYPILYLFLFLPYSFLLLFMFSSVFHIFQIAPIRWPYDSCFLIVGSPSDGSAKDGMSGFGKVSSKGVKSGLRSQPKLRGGVRSHGGVRRARPHFFENAALFSAF